MLSGFWGPSDDEKRIVLMAKTSIKSEDILALASRFSVEGILEMKEKFGPSHKDEDLARFLIARGGDVEKASKLYADHLTWKASRLYWPPSKATCMNELQKGKILSHGVDKEGHPLLIYNSRFHFAKERDTEEMTRMVVWWCEVGIKNLPENKTKLTLLVDRTDFSNENADIEFIKHVGKVFQDNYPERLHRCIVFPTGLVFVGLWNIIKWFLDPVTQAKIQPVLYLAGVQEFIDDEYIPISMGGLLNFKLNLDDIDDPVPPSDPSLLPNPPTHA